MTEPALLIKKIISGDQDAAIEFVDYHKNRVYKICFSLVNNVHDAEDITQEVFIDVFQHLKDFRGESSASTWIYRIAVNKSYNFIRSKKKYRFWKQLDDFLSLSDSSLNEPSIDDSSMDNKEQKAVLQKAINRLPEKQRIAFTLNKIDELSYNEVAIIMEMTHSAVESLIHRAKLNLQRSLKAYFKD